MYVYNNNLFSEIKKEIDLVTVITDAGIVVSSKGTFNCPFHTDKTASVSIKNNRYKCFGCGAYGDIFDFAQLHLCLSKVDSARYFIDRYNLSIKTGYEETDQGIIKRNEQIQDERKAEKKKLEKRKKYGNYAWNRLVDYWKWLNDSEPPENYEDLTKRFIEKCHMQDYIGYLVDVYIHDTDKLADDTPHINKWISATRRRYTDSK